MLRAGNRHYSKLTRGKAHSLDLIGDSCSANVPRSRPLVAAPLASE
jgi:hypothetical protein